MSVADKINRLLLVDDDALLTAVLSAALAEEGYTVEAAADGREALRRFQLRRPDLVVLDVQLEGGSGLQVLKAVRTADPEVAFVVFSNNVGLAYRKRYLGEGAVGFLDKSSEFDQLAEAVALGLGPARDVTRGG